MTGAGTTDKRRYRMSVRAKRSEATAARIRSEALKLFVSRSYDEVTLAEIAKAAGVTVPTLLAHFGRKEDLFVAACEDWGGQVVEQRDKAPVGDHAGAVHNLLDNYETDGEHVLHLLTEEHRFPAVRAMTDRGRRHHRDWVERVFAPSLDRLKNPQRERLVPQLVVTTDLLTWKQLRLDMGLSRQRTEVAIVGMIDALTAAA
jgi:AcrR family transcriptional regulator